MDNQENYQVSPLIYEKLAAIMADVPAIKKIKSNGELPYKFRGIDDVYNTLHPLFVEYQVFTTSQIVNYNREVWTNEKGKITIEYALQVRYRFTAIDGSYVETETMGQAMDTSDKSSNKAMSMAHKAAILQIFMIPTADTEDPDATTPEPYQTGYNNQPGYYQQQQPQQYRQPPQNQMPPAAGRAQNNGYRQSPPPAPPQQQNSYHSNGGGQKQERPASAKSIEYLRDLAYRPQVSKNESGKIEAMIQSGTLTNTQCSALIDTINLFLRGEIPSIFPQDEYEDQNYQRVPPIDQDGLPF